MSRWIRITLFLGCLLAAKGAFATNYYVDYVNGNDAWDGQAKAFTSGSHGPWKNPPGACNQTCGPSANLQPGDSVIFKGCVTWPNSTFMWVTPSGGNAGNPVYYGIDQTWWDNTAAGCSSAWNRPIFDLQGQPVPNATSASCGSDNHPCSWQTVVNGNKPFSVLEGFEIKGMYCTGDTPNQMTLAFTSGINNLTWKNMYVHGWSTEATFTTGTIGNGSTSLTVASTANMYVGEPVGVYNSAGHEIMPSGGNGTRIQSIRGNVVTTSSPASANDCAGGGCNVRASEDACNFWFGTQATEPTSQLFTQNVIDGSDSDIVKRDPNCAGECLASGGRTIYGQPSNINNSVFRYVSNGPILTGGIEVNNNLIEYIRLSVNPFMHTNGFEDNSDSSQGLLFYNNVVRHLNNPRTHSSVGVSMWIAPQGNASNPTFVFNNVAYDLIENNAFQFAAALGTPGGTVVAFNNTVSPGPSWDNSFGISNFAADCSSGHQTCYFYNNHIVTSMANGGLNGCSGANCHTDSSNVVQTASAAAGQGYTAASPFALQPTSASGSTVSANGNNYKAGYCTSIATMSPTAGSACLSDTSYGPNYDPAKQWVSTPPVFGRATHGRSPVGKWNSGAYSFTQVPSVPSGLVTTVQ